MCVGPLQSVRRYQCGTSTVALKLKCMPQVEMTCMARIQGVKCLNLHACMHRYDGANSYSEYFLSHPGKRQFDDH
jgi:hypothetical protein